MFPLVIGNCAASPVPPPLFADDDDEEDEDGALMPVDAMPELLLASPPPVKASR
jgi:hypothetical protein